MIFLKNIFVVSLYDITANYYCANLHESNFLSTKSI